MHAKFARDRFKTSKHARIIHSYHTEDISSSSSSSSSSSWSLYMPYFLAIGVDSPQNEAINISY